MKRATVLSLIAAGTLVIPQTWSAEILTNGNFENTAGWTFMREVAQSADYNHTPGGTYSAKETALDVSFPNAYQDITSGFSVGESYVASVYAYVTSAPAYSWNGGGLKVEYRDSSDTTIGSSESGFITDTVALNTWLHGTVTGTIPAGTAKIRFQLLLGIQNPTPATVYFDDASLTVPEPASLALLGVALGGLLAGTRRRW